MSFLRPHFCPFPSESPFWGVAQERRCPLGYRGYFVRSYPSPRTLSPGPQARAPPAGAPERRTDKIFYRTLSLWDRCPSFYWKIWRKKRKAGQGYWWPYTDLGRLFFLTLSAYLGLLFPYPSVDRRTWVTDRSVPFLPVNPQLSAVRNQGRQKLARFNAREFATLIIDILNDARRRQMGVSPGGRPTLTGKRQCSCLQTSE